MKNLKRIGALAGIIVLLAAFCLPMVFAFGEGEDAQRMFLGAIGVAVLVPVLAYAFLLAYRVFGRKKEEERMIENIVFDVGNVLVDFTWEAYLRGFDFEPEKYEKIADAVFRNPDWDERDRGLYEEEEYIRRFVSHAPEYEADIREVMRRTPECIHVRDYSKSWVEYLRSKGYRLYILSNFSRYMLERNRPDMNFLPYMDGEIFSCEVRQLKPGREIYETLIKRYGLNPQKSVFLDDRPENCEGAKKLGMHAIVFENLDQAAEELKKLGVE